MPVHTTAKPSIPARGKGGMFRSAAMSLAKTSPPASGRGTDLVLLGGRTSAAALAMVSSREANRGKFLLAKLRQNSIVEYGEMWYAVYINCLPENGPKGGTGWDV